MRRALSFLVLALALASSASATFTGKTVSVTATAQTISFGGTNHARVAVTVINDGADTVVFRLYACGETVVPVVFADGATDAVTLKINESVGPDHNPRTQGGIAWCAMTIIADTGDTATVRLMYE
jgi:hypothetical protein